MVVLVTKLIMGIVLALPIMVMMGIMIMIVLTPNENNTN